MIVPNKFQAEIEDSKDLIIKKNEEIKQLNTDLEKIQQLTILLKNQITNVSSELDSSKKKLENMVPLMEYNTIKNVWSELQNKHTKLSNETTNLKKNHKLLKEEFDTKSNDHVILTDKYSKLKQLYQSLEESFNTQNLELTNINKTLTETNTKLNYIESVNVKQTESIETFQNQINTLKIQLQHKDTYINSLQVQLKDPVVEKTHHNISKTNIPVSKNVPNRIKRR